MQIPNRIVVAARNRIKAADPNIQSAYRQILNGSSLRAEPERERAVQRVAVIAKVDPETAARIVDYERPAALGLTGESLRKAEAIQGKSVDYVGVAWLEAGRIASNAVARIIFPNGDPRGTGFLVSNRLLLTNNHVIPNEEFARGLVVEFRYEIGLGATAPEPIQFELAPATFFVTDEEDDLDFTLIALGRQLTTGANLSDFGCCPLSASSAKHSVGEPVTIVQHPDGDYKQVVLRENRILHRGDTVLHYVADTEGGASGSPVFNDAWQVVALHHWGEPHRERSVDGQLLQTDVNEGIRISAIVAELQGRTASMNSNQRQLLQSALNAPPPADFGTRLVRIPNPGAQSIFPNPVVADLPDVLASEIGSERGGGAPASRIDPVYTNRRGYNDRFLENLLVPMPQLNANQRSVAARVSGVGDISNPYELKYQHFSVVLNAQRRMAFFSICNIDGAKRIRVDRDSGKAKSGPEASENWAIDPRVPDTAQLSDAFYRRLRNTLRAAGDFFARGHLTRREDPNWGRAETAERANNDTFHHPNGCPQVQNAFNGSQQAWQGIENYILNATDDSNLRVTVITGPVFSDDDPIYEDEEFGAIAIPRQFWKVVARVEDGKPLVIAILADQSEAMDALFAARRESREALWDWPTRLSKDYISTVATISELTGLDFGNLIDDDINADGMREHRLLVTSPAMFFPRRFANVGQGFGSYNSIGEFLDRWERHERSVSPAATPTGAEKKTRSKPQPRQRKVVEIEAEVARVFADDLSGSKHQQFTIVPTKWIAGTEAKSEVEAAKTSKTQVRVAVRFGDSRGLPDRIPGIHQNIKLKLQGEWISAQDAVDVGGENIPVIHFTHDPIGWICMPDDCFS